MTRDREQDAEMDRLLRAALNATPAGPADACPPPDDLAAYVERTLEAGERDALEVHLAACERCQQSLALMATLPETPAPAASAPARARRFAGWKGWLVPATALASALILYVALRPDAAIQRSASPGEPAASTAPAHPSGQERAAADSEAAVPAPLSRGAGDMAARAEPVEALPLSGRKNEEPARPTSREKAIGTLEPGTPPVSAEARSQQDRALAPVPELAAAPVTAPPAPPPPPAAAAPAGAAAMAEAQASKPVPGAGGGVLAMRPAQMRADEAAKGSKEGTSTVVKAAGPATRLWRLDPGARILASDDSGVTWELQHDGAAGELTAGSAPSREVCWVVGHAGLVLRTTDGKTWAARPFPEDFDLVAVTATDALHASIVSRTGRRFATSDGGATWSAVR